MSRTAVVMLALWVVGCAGDGGETPPTDDEETDPVQTDTGTPDPGNDADGDGYDADVDCDDTDPDVHPDALEVCDGIDNDCNAATDDADPNLDTSTGSLFYVDADGDGFGDAAQERRACEAPDGYVVDDTDCDDGLATANPDARETCDGVDNDCDPATPDAGVSFLDLGGTLSDQTAAFAAGTPNAPVIRSYGTAGVLTFCSGTWHAGLDISADVDVIGAGSDSTTLDGNHRTTGIRVSNGATVNLSGLTLARFFYDTSTNFDLGAGLLCRGDSVVGGDDLILRDHNTSEYGGAVNVSDGCQLTLSNSTLEDNQSFFGGHMWVDDGSVFLDTVTFRGGIALGGGAVSLGDVFNFRGTVFDCTDCTFEDNAVGPGKVSGTEGGAIWINNDTVLTMTRGAFRNNDASNAEGGAVAFEDNFAGGPSEAHFSAVDFSGNVDGLGPNDISLLTVGLRYYFNDTNQTISCDGEVGCN